MTNRGYQDNFFQSHPGIQDSIRRRNKARKIRVLLEKYSRTDLSSSDCLDIGCSAGTITIELSSLFRTIIGIEFDREALFQQHRDQTIPASTTFINGDAMALPFKDESFDFIICAQVYEHVPDDNQLVAEMYRVLRPNGVVFFSGPNRAFPIELHYHLPFLHWLPETTANRCLQLLGKGDVFYERLRTYRGLKRLLAQFLIKDLTINVIFYSLNLNEHNQFARLFEKLLKRIYKLILPAIPNFNFLLTKENHPRN